MPVKLKSGSAWFLNFNGVIGASSEVLNSKLSVVSLPSSRSTVEEDKLLLIASRRSSTEWLTLLSSVALMGVDESGWSIECAVDSFLLKWGS